MLEKHNTYYAGKGVIELLQDRCKDLQSRIDDETKKRKSSERAEKLAKSILQNNTLSDAEKLELLEFVFLTNK